METKVRSLKWTPCRARHDVLKVADALLKIAKTKGKALTPQHLNKLTYLAQGWSLALRDKPLFNNRIEAWAYGPIIPDLYHVTKGTGNAPIPLDLIDSSDNTSLSTDECRFLEQVFTKYEHLDGIALGALTSGTQSPWAKIFSNGAGSKQEIPLDWLRAFYLGWATSEMDALENGAALGTVPGLSDLKMTQADMDARRGAEGTVN